MNGEISLSAVVAIVGPILAVMAGAIGFLARAYLSRESATGKRDADRIKTLESELSTARTQISEAEREKFEMHIAYLQKQLDTLSASRKDTRAAIDMVNGMRGGGE